MKQYQKDIKKLLARLQHTLEDYGTELQSAFDNMEPEEYEDGVMDGSVVVLQGKLDDWASEVASVISEVEEG